jgi:hypothetical protein
MADHETIKEGNKIKTKENKSIIDLIKTGWEAQDQEQRIIK